MEQEEEIIRWSLLREQMGWPTVCAWPVCGALAITAFAFSSLRLFMQATLLSIWLTHWFVLYSLNDCPKLFYFFVMILLLTLEYMRFLSMLTYMASKWIC